MEKRGRILLIDDDVDFVRINQTVLERHGYEVITAFSGAEGIMKARETKPDAILLDFMMETATEGAPVAQVLRDDPDLSKVPLLLVTSVHRAQPWWRDIKPDEEWLPVDKVIDKPVSPETLLAELSKVLPG